MKMAKDIHDDDIGLASYENCITPTNVMTHFKTLDKLIKYQSLLCYHQN